MSLAKAIRAADLELLPTRRQEGWRWTDLRSVLPVLPPAAPPTEAPQADEDLAALGWPARVFVNGRRAGASLEAPEHSDGLVRRFIAASPAHASAGADDLVVPANARMLLVDSFEGRAAGAVTSVGGRIEVGPGAELERLVVLTDDDASIFVGSFEVSVAAGASFSQTVLCSGALRQRLETQVAAQANARVRMDGVYLVRGGRHADQTCELRHQGLGGRSAQLVKGMVSDQARSVFQGRIVVERGADGTDARMGSHALVLSDRAEVDAKPELEIYADDVQCAHGNTVGALDEDALFYARSRGLPEAEAKRLLAAGFVGEVVERIAAASLRDLARAWTERQLETFL